MNSGAQWPPGRGGGSDPDRAPHERDNTGLREHVLWRRCRHAFSPTEAEAIPQTVNFSTDWKLSGATSVTASFKTWTSTGLMRRVGRSLAPYGKRNIWLVTAHGVHVVDAGGAANRCPPSFQPSGSSCGPPRTWDNMMFIVDDATSEVIEATPF